MTNEPGTVIFELEIGPGADNSNYVEAHASMEGKPEQVMIASIAGAIVEATGPDGYERWRTVVRELFLEFMNSDNKGFFHAEVETRVER